MAAPAPRLRLAPAVDDGLALRFYPVTAHDGTVLQAWTNDLDGRLRESGAPTVLLCNGLGTNPWAWPNLLDPTCEVRVISWNHRGVGGSERPADPEAVDMDHFVADAVAVLDDDGTEKAVAMGWSIGVNTAFELAVTHPDRVTGLYAVGGVPGDTFSSMLAPMLVPRPLRKPLTTSAARVMKLLGKPLTEVASRLSVGPVTLGVLTHSGFMLPVADEDIARRAIAEFLTTPVDWYMHLALHSSLHLRVSLSAIDVPASFLAGKYDVLASSHDMRTAADRMQDAEYLEVKASHFLPLERPDQVHEQLLALLERVG